MSRRAPATEYAALAAALAAALSAGAAAPPRDDAWDVTAPRGRARTIEFTASEGTWMSADISPDGGWVVFDLLAHIYRVPSSGGEAQLLTAGTGPVGGVSG